MKKYFMINIIICLFIITLSSVSFSKQHEDAQDNIVYTSIYPIEFVVHQLIGEKITVRSIYPPGVDAHTYEPTLHETINIANGDAFIYLGANMEGFVDQLAKTLHQAQVNLIEIGKHPELFETNKGRDKDPHIWLDPLRMIKMGAIIKNKLIDIYPQYEQSIASNFKKLKDKLLRLDQKYQTIMSQKNDPEIIVSHAAFGYLEDRYNIKQIAISGLSASNEPSQKKLTRILQLAEKKDMKYVLFEKNTANRLSTIVQEQIGAKSLYLHNLEVLMTEDINKREDYFSLMRKNLKILDEATQ